MLFRNTTYFSIKVRLLLRKFFYGRPYGCCGVRVKTRSDIVTRIFFWKIFKII